MERQHLLNWSFQAFRLRGLPVRIHWTLLLFAAFLAVPMVMDGYPLIGVLAPIILFGSVLLHEFGHAGMAHLVGGRAHEIILWMFGGLTAHRCPHVWNKEMAVAAAGPLINFIILGICLIISRPEFDIFPALGEASDTLSNLVQIIFSINLVLLLFNMLPCYPLDGGQILRSGLWPLIGQRRAVVGTIYIAYVILALLLVYALTRPGGGLMLGIMVVLLFFNVLQEHQAVRMGINPHAPDNGFDENTNWWQARQRERERRLRQRLAERESERQQRLDHLLAKVSAEGLPSLTDEERRFLQEFSQQERERSGRL